jgi:3-oxoadipate enol-lactonase
MTMENVHEGDATVNGTRLHYRLDGPADAPVVALVNSLATDLTLWDAQIPALAERYRVLRYDTRGHGRSAAPVGPYTIGMLVEDLLGLLAVVRAERVYVVGVSLGGLTALATALRRAPDVVGIVACDCRADMPPEFAAGIDARNKLVREQGMQSIVATMVERWFTPATLAAKPAYLDPIRRMIGETSVEGFTGCAAAIRNSGLRPRVAAIRVPSLFIVGTEDAALPVEMMQAMQMEVPGSRFATIADAGHLPNVERPEAFNAALLEFLDRGGKE